MYKNYFPYFKLILSKFIKNSLRVLRNKDDFTIPICRTRIYKTGTIVNGIKCWNKVPQILKTATSLRIFKKQIKQLIEADSNTLY